MFIICNKKDAKSYQYAKEEVTETDLSDDFVSLRRKMISYTESW